MGRWFMNAEKIFDVMENIDEQYIIESSQKNVTKNKKKTIRKILVFARVFLNNKYNSSCWNWHKNEIRHVLFRQRK